MNYKTIKPAEFQENIFNLISKDWFLMTAESEGVVNPMTVAWATMGILWQKPVVIVAVRPERYTHEIASAAETFSLTVFGKEYRKMLGFCGTKSGRDCDKIKECGLHVLHHGETPYFEEARLAFICKKMCVSQLQEADFLGDESFTGKWYGGENKANGEGGGYHHLYIAEITDILEKEE
ncbi:flavin reductase family protein [Cuneatibacter caecimuris]|uniref:Flavin reductase like protein n=1 Tax=Cuneatibacter caecimuris TaxID=1796618 RepID=A0A4Q7PPX9_9FIRM|nr:flavin reductase [Cuneatibacter caecimuris]RZT03081.1 flavin reductase like protein [Cuneatibacter caecimuris]